MKKQLIAVGLAGVLTVPSIALADATLYGSFRTGLGFSSGDGAGDAEVMNFGSRFGIRGSSEVSEGLTASYNLEYGFNSSNLSGVSGRHAAIGLSGGFGSITLGQTNTATQNHYNSVHHAPWWFGTDGHSKASRQARKVSYASSVGAVGFQIDRYTDANGTATIEFGASAAAGPVNVGVAHWTTEDYDGTSNPVQVMIAGSSAHKVTDDADRKLVYECSETALNDADTKVCSGSGATAETTDMKLAKMEAADDATEKMSFTGFVISAGLAGMNLAVAIGSEDHGDPDNPDTEKIDESKTDVSIVTLSGSIADSGVSYAVQMTDSDMTGDSDATAMDPSQTVVSLTSDLGGGASLVFEHVAKKGDAPDASLIGLVVNF